MDLIKFPAGRSRISVHLGPAGHGGGHGGHSGGGCGGHDQHGRGHGFLCAAPMDSGSPCLVLLLPCWDLVPLCCTRAGITAAQSDSTLCCQSFGCCSARLVLGGSAQAPISPARASALPPPAPHPARPPPHAGTRSPSTPRAHPQRPG